MEQPVPAVSERDVERIARRDFGADGCARALAIVAEYGKQEWNRPGSPRVKLAILKLADGDLAELEKFTRIAISDFRDVLAWAEYPRFMREVGFAADRAGKEREVIDHDWRQYREWLERGG